MGDCPVMNAARPAVQLCWPYQSVKSAPSFAMLSMFGRPVAHHALVVGADVEPPMSSPQMTRMFGFFAVGVRLRGRTCKPSHTGARRRGVRISWNVLDTLFIDTPPGVRTLIAAASASAGLVLDLLFGSFQVEGAGRLAGRIVLHGHEELRGHRWIGTRTKTTVEEPVVVGVRVVLGLLERVAAQVEEQRHAQFDEGLAPDAEGLAAVLQEDDLPVLVAGGDDLAVVVDVPELVARRFLRPCR